MQQITAFLNNNNSLNNSKMGYLEECNKIIRTWTTFQTILKIKTKITNYKLQMNFLKF